ncbi:hypothetical protein MUP56_00340 [Patescibacteria group bacterium]|nr:hypothetical protein [Patescibacteria group bacterium]
MSFLEIIKNLLGRSDEISSFTADMIIANPDKFNPIVVQTAQATTNIASFLDSLLLHNDTSMIGGGEFQMQLLQNEGVHPLSFSTGGAYPFSYSDKKQSFNGTITLGMKRGYRNSWWGADHPVVEVDMKDLDLTFLYKDKGNWELAFGKGGNQIDPSGDLTMEEYRQVCNALASPFRDLLEKLGEPQWGSSSNVLKIF